MHKLYYVFIYRMLLIKNTRSWSIRLALCKHYSHWHRWHRHKRNWTVLLRDRENAVNYARVN